ncbi:MAG: potassium channel family protein [Christensenellales bacterium]
MRRNKIIVIGSGRMGANIASLLYRQGNDVILIDKNKNAFNKLLNTFGGYEIVGDATDLELLESVFIKQAKEVIIVTGNDNVNMYLAHICFYIYDVPNIYIRQEDADKKGLIENTTIKAIYPFLLSVNDFLRLRESGNE